MKKVFSGILFSLLAFCAYAGHIAGGEIYYQYLGPGSSAGIDKFKITLRLFRDCHPSGQAAPLSTSVVLGYYNKVSANSYNYYTAETVQQFGADQDIEITDNAYPCIQPLPDVCYQIRSYQTIIELPRQALGYVVAYQTCCRANGITNMKVSAIPGTSFIADGATYVAEIPGSNTLGNTGINSSPVFATKDTAVLCGNNAFSLDFGATDPDGDQLTYYFCDAYNRGDAISASNITPSIPPYNSILYTPGYSGSFPLGKNVSINPQTGLISGVAPNAGKYVINVCVTETRNGVVIGRHRKDFMVSIGNCNQAKPALQPSYVTCDGYTLTLNNLNSSPIINSLFWDFGEAPGIKDTITGFNPTHTYADTGTYTIKLIANKGQQCADSTIAIAKLYPGFFPGFRFEGSCLYTPIKFIDTTKTRYGVVNSWQWNFGDLTTNADTSSTNPSFWKYNSLGTQQAQLIVQSSKGCIDTIYRDVLVKDKPTIALAFKDTLICSNQFVQDTLQLSATGFGIFDWTPTTRILNANTPNPLVFPTTTTRYTVQLNENGCINTDAVNVRVVNKVTIDAGPDTTICLTDPVVLNPSGDGLAFTWSPAATLNNANAKNPVATPVVSTTTYTVLARIGKCSNTDDITIAAVPYPTSIAGNPVTKCYEDTVQLNGSMIGKTFNWMPPIGLSSTSILNPLAFPRRTTAYVLRVYDVLGCPKPGLDTVVITVRPPVIANAGNDTVAVINQPLQLTATGAQLFLWSPSNYLNTTTIATPTAIFPASGVYSYIVKVYTPENCFGTDSITIKVYSSAPDIFVPNAFTPGKGQNSFFKPITVGISKLDYFKVYNRWGQLMYTTTSPNAIGWDGTIGGSMQNAGTYVWTVQGEDFLGKRITKKGTVILIR
jgi:gliding motility-associated-like protein